MNLTQIQRLIKEEGLTYEGLTQFKTGLGVWFTDPQTGTTLLMKRELITIDSLKEKVRLSREAFKKAKGENNGK